MVNQLLISQIRYLQYSERDSDSENFSPTLNTFAHTPQTLPNLHCNEKNQDNVR